MIYPFIEEDEIPDGNDVPVPREYEIDYKTGQLTGRVVEGLEAIKAWVWLALQTAKNRFYIYSENYGQEFEELAGSTYTKGFIELEYQRMVEECLLQNEYIESIEEYEFAADEAGNAEIRFKMVTSYGEEEINVRGNDLRANYGSDDE